MVKTTNQKMSDSKKSLYVPETLFSRGPYLKTPWSQWRFGSLGKSTVSEGWKSTSTPCLITKGYAEYTWKLSYSSYIWLLDAPPLFTQTCKVETDKKPRSWQLFIWGRIKPVFHCANHELLDMFSCTHIYNYIYICMYIYVCIYVYSLFIYWMLISWL